MVLDNFLMKWMALVIKERKTERKTEIHCNGSFWTLLNSVHDTTQ